MSVTPESEVPAGLHVHPGQRSLEKWRQERWESASGWIIEVGPGGKLAVAAPFATQADWAKPTADRPFDPEAIYLGSVGSSHYFACPTEEKGGTTLRDIPNAHHSRHLFEAAIALVEWRRNWLFCPQCATRLAPVDGGHALWCSTDGSRHFPRVDPCIIVLVTTPDGDRALLGRKKEWPQGRYSCLAGFVGAGESAQDACIREVHEETGISICDITWVTTQPWPYPANLMLAARAHAKTVRHPRCVDGELEAVAWWSRDEVRAMNRPPIGSVAYALVTEWLGEEETSPLAQRN